MTNKENKETAWTVRECFVCGNDNAHTNEDFVKPILIDGMQYEDVCGYCEEAGLHEEEQ